METTMLRGYAIGYCRSCEAPIIWTLTDKGKRMPVDADPVEDGNIRLDHDRPVHAHVVTPSLLDVFDETDNGDRYVSHFVTCPNADQWRGGEPFPATPGPNKHRTMHRSF